MPPPDTQDSRTPQAAFDARSPSSSANSPEWIALFTQHEQMERSALHIKLVTILFYAVGVAAAQDAILIGMLLLVFWAQEAIVRTGQARLGAHLLRVEAHYRNAGPAVEPPFQLHSRWEANRPNFLGLLKEYGQHARRPTVAFPYAVMALHLLWVLI